MLDSMAIDRASCRCDVQQARLSLHVPLLTNVPTRYVIGLRMCKVRTRSTCDGLRCSTVAAACCNAGCTCGLYNKEKEEIGNILIFVYI